MKRGSPWAVWLIGCLAVLLAALTPAMAWRLLPPRPLGVLILDKTVPDTTYRGHRAVVWVLNHLKLVHPGSLAPYDAASDYAGFVPLTDRAWSVHPLPAELGATRVVYVADTHGVTSGDLGERGDAGSDRLLFGGLTEADVEALEGAARSGATLIGEFNMVAEPTADTVRERAEALFGFRWTGWTGRRSADLMGDVPRWVVTAWERQSGGPWRHEGTGIVLAHRDGRVVVLSADQVRGSGLDIVPTLAGDSLGMRAAPAPATWFDLVEPAGGVVLARYAWQLTPRGDSALMAAGIPPQPAAVLARRVGAGRSYYLAGDFANVPRIPPWTELRWGAALYRVLPGWWLPTGEAFFWRGYLPLLSAILERSAGR